MTLGGSVVRVADAPDICRALRAATAEEHEALEGLVARKGHLSSRDGYRHYLAALYGFYTVLEDARERHGRWRDVVPAADRRPKASLLASDAKALGVDLALSARCTTMPALGTLGEALGATYVLEGATLGAASVRPHIETVLGTTDARLATSFLCAYGDDTAAMWRPFRAALEAYVAADPDEAPAVIAGARTTFRALRVWLEEVPRPPAT